jgi:GNAT superfamily N-acetyltransferase
LGIRVGGGGQAALSGTGADPARGPLQVGVRRARPIDKPSVLAFASATWDGWDYIPEAWDDWLAAPDGALLVAQTVAPDVDAQGLAVEPGRVVALARVTMLAPGEAWIEGIRVDPALRGRDVATNLQVAELAWAAAQGAAVVRYTTGRDNEGSHRLGARHGFRRLADRRTYGVAEEDEPSERPTDPSAVHLLAPEAADAADRWWGRIAADPIFRAGDGLYECRRWAFQALTEERFAAHVRRGEVLVARDGQALAVVPHPPTWPHDGHTHHGGDVALIVGDGLSALSLLNDLRRAAGAAPRVRLADPLPAPLAGPVAEAWRAAGFAPHPGTLHVLARDLPPREPLPVAVPEGALTFLEPPRPVTQAPAL